MLLNAFFEWYCSQVCKSFSQKNTHNFCYLSKNGFSQNALFFHLESPDDDDDDADDVDVDDDENDDDHQTKQQQHVDAVDPLALSQKKQKHNNDINLLDISQYFWQQNHHTIDIIILFSQNT